MTNHAAPWRKNAHVIHGRCPVNWYFGSSVLSSVSRGSRNSSSSVLLADVVIIGGVLVAAAKRTKLKEKEHKKVVRTG